MISLIMSVPNRIVIHSSVAHGKPVIRGTRVPVAVIIGSLASGMTADEIQREYDLTPEDIQAAVQFADKQSE